MSLLSLLPFAAWAQDTVDSETVTTDAIERLRFAQEIVPEAGDEIEAIVERLERSRRGTDGSELILDSCHLAPAPQGLTAWIETRQAVLQLQQLLDQENRKNPRIPLSPAVQGLLTEVRAQIVDAYRFLADVAVQEAQAFADDPSGATPASLAERRFGDAEVEIAAGDVVRGMQSLRQAWEHAQLSFGEESAENSPRLNIQSPVDGATVFASPVDVAGMVQLLTTGTVGADDVTVTVNGQPAEVVQRSFLARSIPLRDGLNALVGVARSLDGGVGTACIGVRFDPTARPRIAAVGGTGQEAPISTPLPDPLAVRVTDDSGHPAGGEQVIFRVIQGDGTLTGGLRATVVETDGDGLASTDFTLGSRAGVGVNRVRATAVGLEGEVVFSPTALTSEADRIHAVSGDNQRGLLGEPLALPLVAVVTDGGQNMVSDVPVTFEVVAGGGLVEGEPQAVVTTDSDGRAAATFTLGSEPGLDNHLVRATFPGLAREPLTFKASGFIGGDPADTRIRGVVLDGQGDPVPGVTLTVEGAEGEARADEDGQFVLTGVPVGEVALEMDATTASRPGVWSSLSFHLHTLPGVDNRLPKPIFTLPLDVDRGKVVGGPEDVTLEIPEVPGFSLTVLAGSVTFLDGSPTGVVSVTPVHADKIPMSPGSGMQPRFIVTVQPAGIHFDPPAPVTYPNVDGLPPGAVTEMFSFDHDLGEFVSIGTGTVSEDGTVVRSDPGFGIVKAGWHCAAPQSESGAGASLQVEITNEEPVIFDEQEKHFLKAIGKPPRDAEYRWFVADGRMVSLDPTGPGLCPDSSQCNTLGTGGTRIGRTTATVTILCTTTGETDSDEIEVIRAKVDIEAEAIDQDDPTNETFDVQDPEVVYGGSEPSTADDLKLKAVVEPADLEVALYTWSVTGTGADKYEPPEPSPDADEWEVGDIEPEAGELEFTVEVKFAEGGSIEGKRKQGVGVRTDDVILVGWINGAGVTLPSGAKSVVTDILPPTGPPVTSAFNCNRLVLELSQNITTPINIPLSLADRNYILHWLFKFADNKDPATAIPGGDFRAPGGDHISFTELDDFLGQKTAYKLVNHFQIKYRADAFGFKGTPAKLKGDTYIGSTMNPCGTPSLVFEGQHGPVDGPPFHLTKNVRGSLINDGSPDAGAVRAFNTLTGKDLPAGTTAVFWENIGSQIRFRFDGGASPEITVQPYPTYYEFRNGRFVGRADQAATPKENFVINPYPFGTEPCLGLGGLTPGGRCGDAESSPSTSARTPPYVVP